VDIEENISISYILYIAIYNINIRFSKNKNIHNAGELKNKKYYINKLKGKVVKHKETRPRAAG